MCATENKNKDPFFPESPNISRKAKLNLSFARKKVNKGIYTRSFKPSLKKNFEEMCEMHGGGIFFFLFDEVKRD